MKLLIIDYISYTSHKNFNRIHLDILIEEKHNLHLVGRKAQFDEYIYNEYCKITEIPDVFYKEFPLKAITQRLQSVLILMWVMYHLNTKEYDLIIFPTYDIMSIWIFHTNIPVCLINHNNVHQLNNRLKLIITRHLTKHRMQHITLNEEMTKRLKILLKDANIYYIPHGICPPSHIIKRPDFLRGNENYLFCPINRNYDKQFTSTILTNTKLHNFLLSNNLILYIKDCLYKEQFSDRIKVIPSSLLKSEYDYMIKHSKAIILPYSPEFKYRCSGILFECMSRMKPILASDISAFRSLDIKNGIYFFNDIESFISSTHEALLNQSVNYDIELYNPKKYWSSVLNTLINCT